MESVVVFVVQMGDKAWLGADGRTVSSRADAVEFKTVHPLTFRQRMAVDRQVETLAGGAGELAELEARMVELGEQVREQVTASLPPVSNLERDADETDKTFAKRVQDHLEARALAFDVAYRLHVSAARAAYTRLSNTVGQLRFAAHWHVALLEPSAWANIADRPLSADAFDALYVAHAIATEETPPGESPPS